MNADAMAPHGLAVLAYSQGDKATQLIVRLDEGFVASMPVSHVFRSPAEFTPIEVAALERCRGQVLDIGAGTGLHALVLQLRDLSLTALDLSLRAADILTQRGVRDVRCADVLQFQGGPFDTLLMLGRGIGMVEDLPGLDRFLAHARQCARDTGQLFLHSLDVRATDDPIHLDYRRANRRAGRYFGTIRMQFEHRGEAGPYCDWLHVDPQTLQQHAEPAGWACEIVLREQSGEFLARLSRTTGV